MFCLCFSWGRRGGRGNFSGHNLSLASYAHFLSPRSEEKNREPFKRPSCLCLATRTKHVESFKEFVVPFIVAVGPSWRQVQQYDLVISKTVSYTFDKFLPALVVLYKILWVFDLPYAKESLPVWMVIQRAFFEMTSSYDIVGTPVQELLDELGYSSQ